jgi:hypothetical protein
MDSCSCKDHIWKGTRLIRRALIHGTCDRSLVCVKCHVRIAINLGSSGPECDQCSPLFSDEFFANDFNLETGLLDGFVYHAGGVRLQDLLTEKPNFKNADYYFEADNVVVELKMLTTEFAQTPEHLSKFEKLFSRWQESGKLSESQSSGREPLPSEFVHEHMRLLREPIQRITNNANNQIKQTKDKLSLTAAKGLVLYLIDGFYEADPNLTITLIGDPLTRHMSSIDGYVVFSLRKGIRMPGDASTRFFWQPKYRDSSDIALSQFVNRLGRQWFDYLEELSGTKFASRIETKDPDGEGFVNAKFSEE